MAGYVLTVIAAAMVLCIIRSIGGSGVMLRLVGGVFLAVVLLQPLARWDFSDLSDYIEDFSVQGQKWAALGQEQSADVYRSVISSEVEAYILDKAKTYGAELTVEVTLDEHGIPREVRLYGGVSPSVRSRLSEMMEQELGIAKEHQKWIG